MKFNPKFTIWVDNKVLIAMVKGSWSQRDAEDYAREFKAAAAPLTGSDWANITLLENWQLGVPGIEPVIKALVNWTIEHGLRYSAHVYWPDTVKEYQLDKMVKNVPSRFEVQKFKHPQQAFDWLQSHGFATDNQQKLAVD
ncbi:hypothetical protein [Arsukibacterium sp.]|uniref:hypothetical protein n=1 Tax=Arsukibacterium sp. TaxID=1977258 RepID=UPI00299D18B9|nr:hypothetical protein [Arsukibacterium sp.]MDX1678061.1 hypothetical protein [Arsukibacterium sp.]